MTGIFKKALGIPDWVIYLLLYILVIVPQIMPIGLPVPVGKYDQKMYDTIEAIPKGTKVLFEVRMTSWLSNNYPSLVIVSEHLFMKGARVIYFCGSTGALNQIEKIVASCPSAKDKVYGEDWITLYPVILMEDAPASAFAANIPRTCPTDFKFRKPSTEYPIMKDVTTASSTSLLIAEGETELEAAIRQISTPYKLATLFIMMGTDHIPFASSNTEAGNIRGYIAATPSAAAYEYMLHRPGTALSIMDSFNTTMTYAIVLLILGNLDYFVSKLRMKSAKGK